MSAPVVVCTFRVAGRLFGIDVAAVREVAPEPPPTRVPHAPPEIRGVVNLRGVVHVVVDLRELLRMSKDDCPLERKLVVLKASAAEGVGLLVDSVGDVAAATPEEGEDARATAGVAEAFLAGVARLPDALVVLLDARRLVAAVRRNVGQSRGDAHAEP